MSLKDQLDDPENEYRSFLQEVVDGGHLEGAPLGITKLVIEKGKEALSDKQKFVFERQVEAEFITRECTECTNDIPWSEMYAAYDNGGLCGWCAHMTEKRERE